LMTAESCAHEIIKAISKKKRTLVLTFQGKQTVWLNKLFPSLTDKLTRKFFYQNNQLIK
jgi:short-subunit dehydrogenase